MSDVVSIVKAIEKKQLRATAFPEFRVGDTVRVHVKIKEGEKERVQAYEGVVIRRTLNGMRGTFTVRKMSYGVGVERVFPFHTPNIDHVDVVSHGRVRRARLFYLRNLQGKAARISEKKQAKDTATPAAADKAPA